MSLKLRFSLLVLVVSFFTSSSTSRVFGSKEILDLVNQDRIHHGLHELSASPTLNLAAMSKADDMIKKNYFGHEAPDGTEPWYWFKTSGYNYAYAGENLAIGFNDPKDLEKSWMASSSHRANILSPFYSEVGVAVVIENNRNVVVQFFGSKESKVSLNQ